MPLKSDGEGGYTATWVPATSGTYVVQVFIDNKHTGTVHVYDILLCHKLVSSAISIVCC